jgi:hypothetical protein
VKGFGSAAIPRVAIRPVRNEEFCDRTPKRGGSHMEGRVTGVKVVSDSAKVWRAVAAAASAGTVAREGLAAKRRDASSMSPFDESNEIKKDRLHLWQLI